MVKPCEQHCCTCGTCKQLRSENLELRDKVQKLQDKILVSENGGKIFKLREEEKINEENGETTKRAVTSQEHVKRLQENYAEAVKKNQELENRILQLASELQSEKALFEETVATLSAQLMDSVEKMNKIEIESMKNKKDCTLVVQLLKCNQSLDREYISHKVDTLPAELKDKVKGELDLESVPNGFSHPPWTKKIWRSVSTSHLDANANTDMQAKSRRSRHHAFTNKRSKSAVYGPPPS